MSAMEKEKNTIKYLSNKTILDKKFHSFIKNNINDIKIERVSIYEAIISELLWLDKIELINEIKYRVTENEDPNDVLIDTLGNDEVCYVMNAYINQLKDFRNKDIMDRFY